MQVPKNLHGFYFLLVLTTGMVACNKEAAFQPRSEEYDLTVKDNPSDPVDHAIYQFYQTTGVPIYYNDTIAKIKVGDSAGIPQYTYQRLALTYSPAGIGAPISWVPLPDKKLVLPMLPLLQDKLLPQLTNVYPVPSLFIVSSSRQRAFQGLMVGRNNKPFPGFNSLMLSNVNPAIMSDSAQRDYIADVLGIIAYKMLRPNYDKGLVTEFDKITASTTSYPNMYAHPLSDLSPDGNGKLEDFSFLPVRYVSGLAQGMTTTQENDFLSYIEAVFFYNNNPSVNFETDFGAYPLIIKKFRLVQKMLKDIGFRIAD
ncbi:MAG: hypothetical protein J7578_12660 [Chitinophagaceae bacterium]|nr:hypothetical protein [Chitinophagaceae bacterium]